MNDPTKRGGLKALGLGALACVGCCAGPVLAFFGGFSVAGLASTTLIGSAGLVIAGIAAVAYLIVRHRRTLARKVRPAEPTSVAAPVRKASDDDKVRVP